MTALINKNDIKELTARPEDIFKLVTDESCKSIMGHLTLNRDTPEIPGHHFVVGMLQVSETLQPGAESLKMLTGTLTNTAPQYEQLFNQAAGMWITEITAADLVEGANKDRHINPGDTMQLKQLQLLRAFISRSEHYLRKFDCDLIDELTNNPTTTFQLKIGSADASIVSESSLICVTVSVYLEEQALSRIVSDHNTQKPNSPLKLRLTQLNSADYPLYKPTLN